METKDDLTRDEAREAIGILALKEDNLESAAIVNLGAFVATASILVIITFKYNLASDLIIIYVKTLIMIAVVLFVALTILLTLRFKGIDKKAKKLAKEHNLEEFYNAVLGKESVRELVNKIIKKLSM